jgi:D-erythronate 2-dehydrogenase
MRVVITGAAGFVGEGLRRRLVDEPVMLGRPIDELVLADRAAPDIALPDFARWHCGDLADPAYLDSLLRKRIDVLFHLASIPGAAAERLPDRGEAVNLGASLGLAGRLAQQGREGSPPVIVFASTIAVYGSLNRSPFSESLNPRPMLSYGAHKLMTEIHLADLSRRNEIDARCLRLPGVVARPSTETGHGSAFLSQIFHKARAGADYVCPVPPDAASWWLSRRVCVENLIHAAMLEREALPPSRVWQSPALHAPIGEVVAALGRRFGAASVARFAYACDETIRRLFADLPPIETPNADQAGFLRDQDPDELVANVFAD